MSKNYLTEAFKEMELLDSDSFSFDKAGAEKLGNFMEDDTLDDFETVIDPEASTEEDLEASYIGKGILACDVCQSMIYKDMDQITIDEESQLANVGELCPYCFNGDGFKVVGKVAPFEDITVETDGDAEVKVDGKVINTDTDPETEEDREIVSEEIESAQKFPVESPVGEVREDLQQAPKKRWTRVTEEVESLKENATKLIKIPAPYNKYFDILEESNIEFTDGMFKIGEEVGGCKILAYITPKDAYAEKFDDAFLVDADEDTPIVVEIIHDRCYPLELPEDLDESLKSKNLREGMEDISITTDDTVIKVKATPREDKETIVPVEPAEVEAAAPVEELPAEEGEESEMTDVDIEEIDEQGFDELGESYLKKVYENVQSYKTVGGSLRGNKIKLEGLITFNSGKKAKTNFIFEAKEMTKKGKLKFIGENVNLTNNKRAFTLTGRAEGKKLICENFNYNYLAKDAKSGNSKRLYGTIKK